MRKVALAQMECFRLKLRPMAVRIGSAGTILPCIDDGLDRQPGVQD